GHFGTLAVALGSFPLSAGHYRSATASRALIRQVFGVWLGLVGASLPRAHPVALPPADITGLRRWLAPFPRLYLNRFRGEPAISRLDWPFTPTHKSSERFSTHTGSGLHSVLPELHPAHG